MTQVRATQGDVHEKKDSGVRCLLCQSDRVKPFFKKKGASFLRCRDCHFIYQDSPPPSEAQQAHYEKGYYEGFGDQVRPIQDARASIYGDFLSVFAPYRETGRILDVGCGHGDFLNRAEATGWEGWGIEPSRRASEFAQTFLGERVLNQTVEATDFPENHFDVVTLWNVIDCLPDPLGALQKVQSWLRPGGLLILRTPNASFHRAIYQFYLRFHPVLKKWGWMKEASVFLRSNFEKRSLRFLLQKSNFARPQIKNGKLTRGDAYQVFSRSQWMEAAKSVLQAVADFVGWLSGQQILIGSSLIAAAVKEVPSDSRIPASARFHFKAIRIRIVMKSLMLHTLALLGYLLGLPLWFKLLGKDRELRILLYHSVNDSSSSDVNVRASEFSKQLAFLETHYRVISLPQAVASLKEKNLPERGAVAITFDDGYQDNYQVAWPCLKKKRFPVSIFLLTGERGPMFLQWDQVREMAASGVAFGSHGESHIRLRDLFPEKAQSEIFESKKKIESEISQPVRFFSYPYGTKVDFDPQVTSWTEKAGYEAAFSKIFGTNGISGSPFELRRIGVEASDTLFTFHAKLNGALSLLSFFDLPWIRKLIRGIDAFFLKGIYPGEDKRAPLLIVSVDFPPHKDGVSTISRELALRIAQRGEPVMAIGPKDQGDREFDSVQDYRTFRLPGYEWGYLRFLPLLLGMPFVVFRYGIRKIFAMNIAYGGILSWGLSFIVPIEYLIFSYGYEFEKVRRSKFICRLYLAVYHRAKEILTCSRLVKERLILFGAEARKIKVLYPAVDLKRYRPLEVPGEYLEKKGLAGRRLILTVGRIIERKGHDQMIKGLPEIIQRFPDVLYGIVGIGPYEETLKKLIRRLGLENHVRFFGKLPDEELTFLYNACEIFVMPSREISQGGHIEGFGIVFLEANACGKPVIGGRSGGVSEAIREGETGFLVAPNHPEEIAEKITFLLSYPEKARAIGGAGLRWVRENFRWDRYVEQAFESLNGSSLP